jgi:hypothetical protein
MNSVLSYIFQSSEKGEARKKEGGRRRKEKKNQIVEGRGRERDRER